MDLATLYLLFNIALVIVAVAIVIDFIIAARIVKRSTFEVISVIRVTDKDVANQIVSKPTLKKDEAYSYLLGVTVRNRRTACVTAYAISVLGDIPKTWLVRFFVCDMIIDKALDSFNNPGDEIMHVTTKWSKRIPYYFLSPSELLAHVARDPIYKIY